MDFSSPDGLIAICFDSRRFTVLAVEPASLCQYLPLPTVHVYCTHRGWLYSSKEVNGTRTWILMMGLQYLHHRVHPMYIPLESTIPYIQYCTLRSTTCGQIQVPSCTITTIAAVTVAFFPLKLPRDEYCLLMTKEKKVSACVLGVTMYIAYPIQLYSRASFSMVVCCEVPCWITFHKL